ncbi:hypothetical protein B0H17DRAFT_1216800 [Mycena rosella]|uniref:Uncharacterized protein n=1 Tax=Mycena rosella TaxID=1033263 RepID=A0AAD7C7Y0_MYCRO|nr:hypothetical protein B0H17DRAFT_1216800 [Mycena rosella]
MPPLSQFEEGLSAPQDYGLPVGAFPRRFLPAIMLWGNLTTLNRTGTRMGTGTGTGDDEDGDEERAAEELGDLGQGYEAPPTTRETRTAVEDRFHHAPIIETFPGGLAGKPTSAAREQSSEKAYESSLSDSTASNPYAPFTSKMDWEVARWAKLRGAGSTAFSDLLNVEGVRNSLNLSYGNSVQLNKIIDEKAPGSTQVRAL